MNPNRLDGTNELPIEIRNKAMWMHLTGLFTIAAAFLTSIFALLIPYLIWNSVRDDHPFVEENSRNSTNFHTSVAIYVTIALLAFGLIIFSLCSGMIQARGSSTNTLNNLLWLTLSVAALLSGVIPITCISLSIYGAVRARKGQAYRYPFTIEFLKPKHQAND
jgi:uncharacterized protein